MFIRCAMVSSMKILWANWWRSRKKFVSNCKLCTHRTIGELSIDLSVQISKHVGIVGKFSTKALELIDVAEVGVVRCECTKETVRLCCRTSKHWGEEFRSGIVITTLQTMENVLNSHSSHSIRIPNSAGLWHTWGLNLMQYTARAQ